MAARTLHQQNFTFRRDVVEITGKGTGASAADLTALNAPGITSIAYNAATGKLKITLEDKWNSLLFFAGTVIDATTPDDWEVVVESEDVAGAKTISIACFKGGTLADLTTDEKLMVLIKLSNTSRTR